MIRVLMPSSPKLPAAPPSTAKTNHACAPDCRNSVQAMLHRIPSGAMQKLLANVRSVSQDFKEAW
jgi:hypothetical protein